MIVLEAPEPASPRVYRENGAMPSIFLGGGITGCPDWQADMIRMLADKKVLLFNPRRPNFPIHDPAASEEQIAWEHEHLRLADAIMFWFPCETLCPITLYELGAWSMRHDPLFVGCHPDYQRKRDVEIQTRLVRPEVRVQRSLWEVAKQLEAWIDAWHATPLSAKPMGAWAWMDHWAA